MNELQSLRDHVVSLLRGGQAYEPFDAIVGEFTGADRGRVPAGAEHSAWQVLEHLRIAQRDILDFSQNEEGRYQELKWPDDYWPTNPEPPTAESWEQSVRAFLEDRGALEALAREEQRDLFRPFPWGSGQTLLREILLAADHQAYHLGQLVLLRRLLDA